VRNLADSNVQRGEAMLDPADSLQELNTEHTRSLGRLAKPLADKQWLAVMLTLDSTSAVRSGNSKSKKVSSSINFAAEIDLTVVLSRCLET
jgi:hypothetical protein